MKAECENINPYGADDPRHKASQVEEMFDNIAPAYDFMNRAMTMGIDRRWRRLAVSLAAKSSPRRILDVATGTGDLAITLAKSIPESEVTGIDLSEGMIRVGEKKIKSAGLSDRVRLRAADCLALPFEDNSFDVITAAFGVRNFEHLDRGYAEMLRVLRPGGQLIVLELSTPTSALIKPLYQIYTRGVIPIVGRIVSHDSSAYSYLPASIAAVPQGSRMTDMMLRAGFGAATFRPLTFGVCTLYAARK